MPALLVLVIFDRRTDTWTQRTEWLLVALAALFDREQLTARRFVAAICALLIPALALLAALTFTRAWQPLIHYQVPVLWAAVAWLYSIYPVRSVTHIGVGLKLSAGSAKAMLWIASLAMVFASWATLSAAFSINPAFSYKLLGAELLPFTALLLLLPRLYQQDSLTCSRSANACWWIVTAGSVGMAVSLLLHTLGGTPDALLQKLQFFRIDADAPSTLRFQYLFQHHNRAGVFAACALILCYAGFRGSIAHRVGSVLGMMSAAIALPFTTTRGAMAAAAVGTAVIALGAIFTRRARHAIIALAITIPVAGILTPHQYRAHIARLFSREQYTGWQGGSIYARGLIWETVFKMVEKRPWLGFGYGFENFEAAAQQDHPETIGYFRGAVHAHNQWLETAAEVGIPGLLLLFGFTILRLAWLIKTWWRCRFANEALAMLLLAWIALEVTIQFYGLTNYALRRGLGLFIYGVWSVSIIMSLLGQSAIKAHKHQGTDSEAA